MKKSALKLKRRMAEVETALKMAMGTIEEKETYIGGIAVSFLNRNAALRTPKFRSGTKITSIFFEIGDRYSHADAFTNNGVGIYAVTRRSNKDPHSPELAVRVLAGKLYHALETYQEGESLQSEGIRFAAVIPADSMVFQEAEKKGEKSLGVKKEELKP